MNQKQKTPPGKGGAKKSIALAAIGRNSHSTEALQTQYLTDSFLLKRQCATLIASLHYGELRDVE